MSNSAPQGDPGSVSRPRRSPALMLGVIALVVLAAVAGYVVGQSGDDPSAEVVSGTPSETAQPVIVPSTREPAAAPSAGPAPSADPEDDLAPETGSEAPGQAAGLPDVGAPNLTTPAPPEAQPIDQGTFDLSRTYQPGEEVTFGGQQYTAEVETVGWYPTPDGHPSGVTGFGARATGGAGGEELAVTTLADDGPGSLRQAIAGDQPKWVRFDVDGTIESASALSVGANTTIDGRGSAITLSGFGLDIRETENVIVTNLTFDRLNPQRHEVDGIRVTNSSRDVWIDHVTLSRINDEAINIGEFSTGVTVSWTHIFDQDRGILVGNHRTHDTDVDPSFATIDHTWFEGLNQRSPRVVRWGRVYMVNSLIDGWTATGASAAQNAQLLSEANVYVMPEPADDVVSQQVITRGGQGGKNPDPGFAASVGDFVEGQTDFAGLAAEQLFSPTYAAPVATADESLAELLRTSTGAQDVPAGGPWTPVE